MRKINFVNPDATLGLCPGHVLQPAAEPMTRRKPQQLLNTCPQLCAYFNLISQQPLLNMKWYFSVWFWLPNIWVCCCYFLFQSHTSSQHLWASAARPQMIRLCPSVGGANNQADHSHNFPQVQSHKLRCINHPYFSPAGSRHNYDEIYIEKPETDNRRNVHPTLYPRFLFGREITDSERRHITIIIRDSWISKLRQDEVKH